MIRLQVLLPTEILLDAEVSRVIAEGEDGSFCLLPKHVDFVSALLPGLLTYVDAEGITRYVGTSDGILVKKQQSVQVSVRHAVTGMDIGELRSTVAERFRKLDEQERAARSVVARIEGDFVRRFLKLEEAGGG